MEMHQPKDTLLDFYAVNADYYGNREVSIDHKEIVSYRESSFSRIWCNDQSDNYDWHWHIALEIIMPVENYYDVTVNKSSYHILPGEILFIPPGELHELTAPKTGKRFVYIFDLSQLSSFKGFSKIQSLLASPIYITRENYPYIYDTVYSLLIQIRDEYFSNNEYWELTIISHLITLLTKFGYNHSNGLCLTSTVRLHKQKEYISKFNDLLDYIDAHYTDDLSLEEVAGIIGFSKFHFSRLFKQYTNFTFCDYLCFRRIKAAEDLLINPEYSITEVALQSGFPSISTFNRIFKQQKGCTPSEYRSKSTILH